MVIHFSLVDVITLATGIAIATGVLTRAAQLACTRRHCDVHALQTRAVHVAGRRLDVFELSHACPHIRLML